MINIEKERRLKHNLELRRSIHKVMSEGDIFLQNHLKELAIADYKHSIDEAVVELGLDDETVICLIEDYILQILKAKTIFFQYIQELKQESYKGHDLDYTNFRDLVHKNLGVVRNLRIEDAIIILEELMVKEDLDYLRACVKALEISAIKLNPLSAYETLKLIAVKNAL